jgi:hypothetical protein
MARGSMRLEHGVCAHRDEATSQILAQAAFWLAWLGIR